MGTGEAAEVSSVREELQKAQYRIPYHWIPTEEQRMWIWPYALEYLCYMKHCAEIVRELKPKTLLDVGCGDGRFLEELGFGEGCDMEPDATRWAQQYVRCMDAVFIKQKFEMVTAIEVLEHIPEKGIHKFIRTLQDRASKYILICVPTTVYKVTPKHYRHYDEDLLMKHTQWLGKPMKLERVVAKRWWWDLINMVPSEKVTPFLWKKLWNNLRFANSNDGRHLVGVWRI